MIKYIHWLEQRRIQNLFLALAYFVFIIFMHDPMVNLSVLVMNFFTRQVYDVVIGALAFAGLLGVVYFFIRKLVEFPHARELKIAYLLILVSLIFVHSQVSFVMNIELIHTAQFGILALLVFPLVRKFGATGFYTLLLAFVDEWFQYQILYPDKSDYFDFNDVVTDMLGAGFALVVLYAAGVNNKTLPPKIRWYQSGVFYLGAGIATVVGAMYKLAFIQTYSENENAWLTLKKVEYPEPFWRNLPDSDIVYHVMEPLEGLCVLALLLGLLFALDYFARRSITSAGCAFHASQRLANSLP